MTVSSCSARSNSLGHSNADSPGSSHGQNQMPAEVALFQLPPAHGTFEAESNQKLTDLFAACLANSLTNVEEQQLGKLLADKDIQPVVVESYLNLLQKGHKPVVAFYLMEKGVAEFSRLPLPTGMIGALTKELSSEKTSEAETACLRMVRKEPDSAHPALKKVVAFMNEHNLFKVT